MLDINLSEAALGAEVRGVDLGKIDDETFAAIHRAWLDHLVLVFPDQALTDDDLIRFSARLGELDPVPPTSLGRDHVPGKPEIMIISNVVEDGEPIGILGSGEAAWHTDQSFQELPPKASLLYATELPATGGETMWVSMYAALDGMPSDLRARIEGRLCKHDATYDSSGDKNIGRRDFDDVRDSEGATHPLVIAHPETGREALFYGRRLHGYVHDLDVADSEALLDEIHAHTVLDRFTFTHVWRLHDAVLWDNRCTMHRRAPFDPAARRIMRRTQIKGDVVPAAT